MATAKKSAKKSGSEEKDDQESCSEKSREKASEKSRKKEVTLYPNLHLPQHKDFHDEAGFFSRLEDTLKKAFIKGVFVIF